MNDRAVIGSAWHGGAWGVVSRLVEADGTAAHPWYRRLTTGKEMLRDLGDAVHALATLYGQHPGLADEALLHAAMPGAADWLADVSAGFATERAVLAQLAAAAGPLPSTTGQAEAQAAITGQAHALVMLARSDRGGCAVGAVAALLIDWSAVRQVLNMAAGRFGVTVDLPSLPSYAETASLVAAIGAAPACERAIGFGAQQLLAQHRGLWSLLEARASARHG